MALDRITARMVRSPFARSTYTHFSEALMMRTYARSMSISDNAYPEELDSIFEAARAAEDTTIMFASLDELSKVTMLHERDLSKALGYLERALQLDPRKVLLERAPDVLRRLAEHYDNVRQWDRSLEFSRGMVVHGLRTSDTIYQFIGHSYMAAEFQQLGLKDSIDLHADQAKHLLGSVSRNITVPSVYALLAGIERQRGRDSAAGPLLDSARALCDRIGQPMSAYSLCALEQAWHDLHLQRTDAAERMAEAMRAAPDWSTDRFARQCYYQIMDSVCVAKGDYLGAYENNRRHRALRDSMNLTAAATNLQRIENNYKEEAARALRQLEQQAAADQLQKERTRRNVLLAAGMVAVIFGSISYRQRRRTQKALRRSDELLLNILPEEVAEELKAKGHADAKHFDDVSILFTDFKGFTEASEKLSPQELVEELNTCFKAFDGIITARGIEKIKTIGDAYMCAGGLPDPTSSTPTDVVRAALEMQAFMVARKTEREALGKPAFEMRVGIHTGPVVAGIVGVKKFAYDIWGDTVNTASRMESSGEVGQVNISESTYALVKDASVLGRSHDLRSTPSALLGMTEFVFTARGKVQAKGKGEMEMYFVRRSSERA